MPHYLNIDVRFKDGWIMKDTVSPSINPSAIGSVKLETPSQERTYFVVIGELFKNSDKILSAYQKLTLKYLNRKKEIEKQAEDINRFLLDPLAYSRLF